MFSLHSMIPDADVMYGMMQKWKEAVDEIADVQGLPPTFIMNISPASAARVAQENGVGNVWGLDDEPLICKAATRLVHLSVNE